MSIPGLPFIPVTDPKQAAEMRLAQAQETVLAAALAYDDAENEPTNGSTARAAYWGRYTTALGDYASVHAEVFAPTWPRVYMDLLVQAGHVSRETEWPAGPPPKPCAEAVPTCAEAGAHNPVCACDLPLGHSGSHLSHATLEVFPMPSEPCEMQPVGNLGRAMCLSHERVIERGLRCPVGGAVA